MLGKTPIDFSKLFRREGKLFFSLRIIKAFPKSHGQRGGPFQRPVRRPRIKMSTSLFKAQLLLRPRSTIYDNGRMFWFMWKKLLGSYFFLISWSRR